MSGNHNAYESATMNQLETTIIEQARSQLTELRAALMQPECVDRDNGISSAFWMLSGLTILANFGRSGMSDEASKQLLAIDAEAAGAMAAARLVGTIPASLPS